jgi:cation diffusion facilitator CzcD-associated flavoprotein CzcO
MFILLLMATALAIPRHLQTVYPVIVIGAGPAGIGAAVKLAENNIDHLIL